MKIATPQLRKRSLPLALLAAIGLSSSAVMAQEPAPQQVGSPPPAEAVDARAAAQGRIEAAESEMSTGQQGAPTRSEQQQSAQQQASWPEQVSAQYITGQAVVTGEDGRTVLVRSRPNLLPQGAGMDRTAGQRQEMGATGRYDVSGDSVVSFSDLDENGDGFVSREEAQANPDLGEQFTTADRDNDGRLSPAELDDWSR